jgi:hypothetical protein
MTGHLAGTAARHPLSDVVQGLLRMVTEPPVVSPLVITVCPVAGECA